MVFVNLNLSFDWIKRVVDTCAFHWRSNLCNLSWSVSGSDEAGLRILVHTPCEPVGYDWERYEGEISSSIVYHCCCPSSWHLHCRRVDDFTQSLLQRTRCTPASNTPACLEYERCKTTHRCPRAEEEYIIDRAILEMFDQEYPEGLRRQIHLMNDFEDWKTGMHHWKVYSGIYIYPDRVYPCISCILHRMMIVINR